GRRALETVTVTCSLDSRAHDVPDAELAAAAPRSDGHYQAPRGHMVAGAPMVEPDRQPCLRCPAIRDRTPTTRPRARRRLLRRAPSPNPPPRRTAPARAGRVLPPAGANPDQTRPRPGGSPRTPG